MLWEVIIALYLLNGINNKKLLDFLRFYNILKIIKYSSIFHQNKGVCMVRTIIEDKTAIINIEKNIISENVDILEEKLNYIKNAGVLNLIFDFHNIEYMCSSALGLIASTLRLSGENGGVVYFCSLSKQLKSLFEATKFLTIVNTADNIDEALKNIK